MLYLSGIDYESMADGDGVRCVIFISGCQHECHGCHSPQTHDFEAGEPVTHELIRQINEEMAKRPLLSGITISGGDAMYSAYECIKLLDELDVPNDNVWLYTGFTFEEIQKNVNMMALLTKCDVLVDGPFDIDRRDISLRFKGSSNQRIIHLCCDNCQNHLECELERDIYDKICFNFLPINYE